MGDLNKKNAAGFRQIVGSDPVGKETTPVRSTANQDFGVVDVINTDGDQASVVIGLTAVEIKIGGANMTERKSVTLQNLGTTKLYWGYKNTVSTANGTRIFRFQFVTWAVGPGQSIWVISDAVGGSARITEGA